MRTFTAITASLLLAGCFPETTADKERKVVEQQQSQYLIAQPVPVYDWSLERHLIIQLYNIRNQRANTHSVWRANYGAIEGDCPSMGYGVPYDTSLTNPWTPEHESYKAGAVAVGQPEPNGIFASTATAATWVMCIGEGGAIEPHYVETKVTVYPYPVTVDYNSNRVTKSGKTTVTIRAENGN